MVKSFQKQPNQTSLTALFITLGFLLFGFAILIIGIDWMHMRPDEELTYRNMDSGFFSSMYELITRNNQAPLWWVQIWVWQRLAGLTEFAGRINSILWSMVTLSLIYRIGKSWFKQSHYGWFSMAVLSVNSYFLIYALEIRMYALGMLVVTLSMYLFQLWLSRQTTNSAIRYGLSTALMLYVHYYFAFVVLAQVVYFVVFHLLDVKMMRQGVLVAIAGLVTWVAGILILIQQLQFIGFVESGGLNIPTKPTTVDTIIDLLELASNGWVWVYGIILVLGIVFLWRKRWFWLILAWLIISPALVFLINTQITIYNVRYISFLIPSIGLAMGVSLAGLPFRGRSVVINWIALTVLCGMSLYTVQDNLPVREPLRTIFTDIGENYQAGDVFFALPNDTFGHGADQMRRYLPAQMLDSRVFDIDEALNTRRVWFLASNFFGEEAQTAFRTLQDTHRLWYVADASDCTSEYCYIAQLLLAPPRENALFFGDTLGYLGADIDPIKDGVLPVLLWWTVEETPSADYSISLRLVAQDGALVAQLDRQIDPPSAEVGEIPTSQMNPDGSYIDLREMVIPDDLPAGDYTLELVVYQWWDGVRLTLPDGTDIFEIETLAINR